MTWQNLSQTEFLYNKIEYWVISAATFIICSAILYIMFLIAIRISQRLFKGLDDKDDHFIVAILKDIKYTVIFTIGIFISIQFIYIAPHIYISIKRLIIIFLTIRIAIFLQKFFIDKLQTLIIKYVSHLNRRLQKRIEPVLGKILGAIIWITVLLLIIGNLGYNLTSLVAGLGIGGIFIGLAAQETLSNFFSSLSVFLDQPFDVKDIVEVAGIKGKVEDFGLRSTRVRTWEGTLVIIPNNEIAKQNIINISKRTGRRTDMMLGLTYDTTSAKLKEALQIIKDTLSSNTNVQNKFRVNFLNFGSSALEIEIVYFVELLDTLAEVQQVREDVNMRIKNLFEKAGIEFAYPSQTLYIKK